MDHITYKNWNVALSGTNTLTIQTNNNDGSFYKRNIKIEESCDYVFKLMKTKILAKGGASGLFHNMKYWINENFCADYVDRILEHTETMKTYNK